MPEQPSASDKSKEDKQREFFERARKGVLKFLLEKGGSLPLDELHDYSMQKFFIQHQGFSRMMETFVNQKLVDFDFASNTATLTEAGRNFVKD